MKRLIWTALASILLLGKGWTTEASAENGTNIPPQVAIVWPRPGDSFSTTTLIKIKAEASDPDGTIAQVQVFADTNLVGVVTNSPFNVIWALEWPFRRGHYGYDERFITAVAIDNRGATTTSRPVLVGYYKDPPPAPTVEIISPRNGAIFGAPATFLFTAELLAAYGFAYDEEFLVGTNTVGIVQSAFGVTAPPSSVVVSNLLEGEYGLVVRTHGGGNWDFCRCNWTTNVIRVVKLGISEATLTPEGHVALEAVTSFPGKPTVMEVSTNLHDWSSISTNVPDSQAFRVIDPALVLDRPRFYRLQTSPD